VPAALLGGQLKRRRKGGRQKGFSRCLLSLPRLGWLKSMREKAFGLLTDELLLFCLDRERRRKEEKKDVSVITMGPIPARAGRGGRKRGTGRKKKTLHSSRSDDATRGEGKKGGRKNCQEGRLRTPYGRTQNVQVPKKGPRGLLRTAPAGETDTEKRGGKKRGTTSPLARRNIAAKEKEKKGGKEKEKDVSLCRTPPMPLLFL